MNDDVELDICADFLSERKYEPLIYSIFQAQKGEWCVVNDLLNSSEEVDLLLECNIYVCWVDPLQPDPGFSLIMFCDAESMQLFSGIYNKDRLFREYST